ncbi:hypothetical protein N4Q70_00605 [Salmonella enterica subsp. enterica serovar Weltevreden]
MSQPFDFDKALKALQSGQALTGKYTLDVAPSLAVFLATIFAHLRPTGNISSKNYLH